MWRVRIANNSKDEGRQRDQQPTNKTTRFLNNSVSQNKPNSEQHRRKKTKKTTPDNQNCTNAYGPGLPLIKVRPTIPSSVRQFTAGYVMLFYVLFIDCFCKRFLPQVNNCIADCSGVVALRHFGKSFGFQVDHCKCCWSVFPNTKMRMRRCDCQSFCSNYNTARAGEKCVIASIVKTHEI